jgi:DNA repair protein RadC
MIIKLKEEFVNSKIKNSSSSYYIFQWALQLHDKLDQQKESLYVMGLKRNCNVKYLDLTSMGSLSGTVVHAREVFRRAIVNGVATIIIGHNHPSGSLVPSAEDDQVTKSLKDAGAVIGIQLLDHIVFSWEGYYSYADQGRL